MMDTTMEEQQLDLTSDSGAGNISSLLRDSSSATSSSTRIFQNNRFMTMVKDLPKQSNSYYMGNDKKYSYPSFPQISLMITNLNYILGLDCNVVLSCHVLATTKKDPAIGEIYTFSEAPLNKDMKLKELIQKNHSNEMNGSTIVSFQPK